MLVTLELENSVICYFLTQGDATFLFVFHKFLRDIIHIITQQSAGETWSYPLTSI